MHTPAAVAAWAEWVVWTCNYQQPAGYSQKRADFKSALFFVVRPAGRTHSEVKVLYTADMGKC
jgi:hypothetical protein